VDVHETKGCKLEAVALGKKDSVDFTAVQARSAGALVGRDLIETMGRRAGILNHDDTTSTTKFIDFIVVFVVSSWL
jgi:hypothetical protein